MSYKGLSGFGFQNVAIGHVEEMAALRRFSYKKMYRCYICIPNMLLSATFDLSAAYIKTWIISSILVNSYFVVYMATIAKNYSRVRRK